MNTPDLTLLYRPPDSIKQLFTGLAGSTMALPALLARGVHIKVESERAGHNNVAISLAIYGHVIPGMQEHAAALVDQTLRAALEE